MRFVVPRTVRPVASRGGLARAHAERCASCCKIESGWSAARIKERFDVSFDVVVIDVIVGRC
eukprot:6178412-Pleurochrysis_carterae.AAC.1